MHDWLNGCGANWLQSWPRNPDTNPARRASKNKTEAGRRIQRVPTSGVRKRPQQTLGAVGPAPASESLATCGR